MSKLLFFRGRHFDHFSYNLIPFETIGHLLFERKNYNMEHWIKNLFGNIILFIPIGFVLPVVYKGFIRWFPFFLIVVILLFVVENIQLLALVGTFDIDDIILNTFGALIGLKITKMIVSKMEEREHKRISAQ